MICGLLMEAAPCYFSTMELPQPITETIENESDKPDMILVVIKGSVIVNITVHYCPVKVDK